MAKHELSGATVGATAFAAKAIIFARSLSDRGPTSILVRPTQTVQTSCRDESCKDSNGLKKSAELQCMVRKKSVRWLEKPNAEIASAECSSTTAATRHSRSA